MFHPRCTVDTFTMARNVLLAVALAAQAYPANASPVGLDTRQGTNAGQASIAPTDDGGSVAQGIQDLRVILLFNSAISVVCTIFAITLTYVFRVKARRRLNAYEREITVLRENLEDAATTFRRMREQPPKVNSSDDRHVGNTIAGTGIPRPGWHERAVLSETNMGVADEYDLGGHPLAPLAGPGHAADHNGSLGSRFGEHGVSRRTSAEEVTIGLTLTPSEDAARRATLGRGLTSRFTA